jgi:Xaa-Pro aminopeptidase
MGTPKKEWTKAYAALLTAQTQAVDYLSTKNPTGAEADERTRKNLEASGFPPYPHSLGHAVGLDIHEMPRLSIYSTDILVPGMVFSVEPGVYIPNQYGIRLEDLVLLTDHGIDVLSASPKDLDACTLQV